MKKFASINKRSSQLFLTKRAQTFLKMASIYDEFGDYKMAEAIQAEAIKYSKYIKVAEDLSEEDSPYLYEETDVNNDIENIPTENIRDFVNSLTPPEFKDSIINSINPQAKFGQEHQAINSRDFGLPVLKNTFINTQEGFSDLLKLVLSWLAPGGNNIYKCLVSLSENFRRTKSEMETLDLTLEQNMSKKHIKSMVGNFTIFNRILSSAMAAYFKAPGFIFEGLTSLVKNINDGNIDAGSVETVKYIIDLEKESLSEAYNLKKDIINTLPELPSDPELLNKIVLYLFRKLSSHDTNFEEISETDIKKLSLAILHGNNNYFDINIKYDALMYLPENLAMSAIDKPLSDLDESVGETIINIIGFRTNVNYKSPVFRFLYDYLAKHPEVGEYSRYGFPIQIKYNELLFMINLLPPDKIDPYLRGDFYSRSSNKFENLGRFLFEQGNLPDYESVCEEIESIIGTRHAWSNINYYISYKANKDKATKVFQSIAGKYEKLQAFNDVNLTIINPEEYLDYLLANPNNENFDFKVDEFSLLYAKLGSEIFNYPPVLIKEICNKLSKTINFDDPTVFEFAKKVININPDFASFSNEDQEKALSFYRENADYLKLPYHKVINFQKFCKSTSVWQAANHLFLFGDFNPDFIDKTPRFISYSAKSDSLKTVGNQIKENGYFIGNLKYFLDTYTTSHFDEELKNRPIQEISIAIAEHNDNESIKKKFQLIDEVKESIKKAANINQEYAELVPGSRDYYYIVSYLCDNNSLRGQSVKSFLMLRDSRVKSRFLSIAINENEKLTNTIITRTGLEPTSENFLSVSHLISTAVLLVRNAFGNEMLIIGLSNLIMNHNINNQFNYEQFTDIEARNNLILETLYETKKLPNIPEIPLVNSIDLKISSKYDNLYDDGDAALQGSRNKIANIVSIFGRLLYQVLDKFARIYCKSPNVRDLKSVPNDTFRDLINDFFDNLPVKQQDYRGYAQFFNQRLNSIKDLGQIRKIGERWNSSIKIFDERNQIVGTETVKDIALKYSLEQLLFLLEMTSFSEIYEDYENANPNFLRVYCKYDSACEDKESYDSAKINQSYPLREKIYLDSLKVPLPSWANYRKTVDKPGTKNKITLRFLPRNDARGLYLGVMAINCQHPDGEAACCAIDGQLSPKAAFMVFEMNNEIIAECYTWEDNNRNICLDSFETIGNEAYHSDTTKQIIENLIHDFGRSQSDNIVTIGNNKFNFRSSPITLKNPTTSYKDYVEGIEYNTLYREDHSTQYVIKDNRKKAYLQDEYDRNNPVDYGMNFCYICGNNALNDEEDHCLHCRYSASDYKKCPQCTKNTLDEDLKCQNRTCDYEYYEDDEDIEIEEFEEEDEDE